MDQTIINLAIGALGTLVMFLLNAVWNAIKDLQKTDNQLSQKVSDVKELIVGNYVKRDEFTKQFDELFKLLRSIETAINDRFDKKADK